MIPIFTSERVDAANNRIDSIYIMVMDLRETFSMLATKRRTEKHVTNATRNSYHTYIFFLTPFLPLLAKPLFLPTAIMNIF